MTRLLPPLPSAKAEDWRYSDLAALATVWPTPPAETIRVAAGGDWHRLLVLEGDAVAVRDLVLTLEPGARATLHLLATGDRLNRVTIDATLQQGAHCELNAVLLGDASQTLEIVTAITHAAPGATSRQTVRSVLGGQATGTYLGRVTVAPGAQQSDAVQSVKALLLSRTATANARPELEIFADDVRCTHGATVGQLDADALFYLESRGIAPAAARRLLVQAFIGTVFDTIADPVERERIETAALAALERML